jgi:DinB superfamily
MAERSHDARNDDSRERLTALTSGLDEADLARDLGDGWTVGALLAHLAFWDGLVEARWEYALQNGDPTPAGIDDTLTDLINAAAMPTWQAVDRGRISGVVASAAMSVDRLIVGLPDTSVEAIGREGRPRLLDRSLHRTEHVAMIDDVLDRGAG